MKMAFIVVLLLVVSSSMHSNLFAAELLDVKLVVAGDSVSVEISADIAMTYTYYKVPGQARAVVDIAEADPEKIEPLIVVNKGVVSSISVDNAQISGIVASRIIFNLVSDADIAVTASPDRKLLVVTFGGTAAAAGIPEIKPDSKPEIKSEAVPGVATKTGSAAAVAIIAAAPSPAAAQEEDPLGLDGPAAKPAVSTAKTTIPAADGGTVLSAASAATRSPKLEPVVPVTPTPARSSALMIKEIVTGAMAIEIHTNLSVPDFKIMKLSRPDRLVIDLPCEKADQKPEVIAINKFGISKVRVGVSPKFIRIVLDSSKAGFPAHTITRTAYGLRINFK